MRRAVAVAAPLLIALMNAPTHAIASGEGSPLVVDVRDYADVARVPIDTAVANARAVFSVADIDVRITVQRHPRKGLETATPAPAVTVFIYPRMLDDHVSPNPKVLGGVPGAASGGRLAYVFASRIEVQAKRNGIDYGRLLGVVLAHEIGHVLLHGRPHARAGLMRAVCDVRQIRNVMMGRLAFTPEEAAVMKTGLF